MSSDTAGQPEHGTVARYKGRTACRCELCRAAMRPVWLARERRRRVLARIGHEVQQEKVVSSTTEPTGLAAGDQGHRINFSLRAPDPVEFRKLLGVAAALADEPRGQLLTRLLRAEVEKLSDESLAS